MNQPKSLAAKAGPDVKERLAVLSMDARGMTSTMFSAYVKSEIAKWAKVVKASGAKPE